MLIFILKFSACLSVFMIFYKVFLERSSMHHFKRFYLLGAAGYSMIIPSLTMVEYVEPAVLAATDITKSISAFEVSETIPIEATVNHTSVILWSIYGIGAFLFLLKFCLNLRSIISSIKKNPKYKSGSYINVLVSKLVIPHTFFNYIFLNKNKFENSEIPREVILHEQTHATQMHSIDIIILEVLQIVFWFNPIIYLLKKDVKLNHEFLADREVLKHGIQPSVYQNLLLTFSSKGSHTQLANAINYSSIKKRFTVMKTQTSKPSSWLRSILLLPILAILFFSFTESIYIEREPADSDNETQQENTDANNTTQNPEIVLFLNEKGDLLFENEIIKIKDFATVFHLENEMTISIMTTLDVKKDVTASVTKRIQDFLREQGLKKFTVCTVAEKGNQEGEITAKQLNEYNRLAKHYNSIPVDKRVIKKIEIERLERLYNLMSNEQKSEAQPFPKCPPPPPPAVVNTGFITINDELHYYVRFGKQTYYYNHKGYKVSKEGKTISSSKVNASDVIPGNYITKVYLGNEIFAEFKDNDPSRKDDKVDSPPPPPPTSPAPKSTLHFAKELVEKNAIFHFEAKEISSEKAIEILKNNSELNMRVKHSSTKQPLVFITKNPIGEKDN